MKILQNFDTGFKKKLYKSLVEKYGKDKVYVIEKSKVFVCLYFFLPLITFTLFFFFIVLTMYAFGIQKGMYLRWEIIGFLLLGAMSGIFSQLLNTIIDYKMDYAIITPDEVLYYDQTGFFSRKEVVVRVGSLKDVEIDKVGFFQSLFGLGTITLSEHEDSAGAIVSLGYISKVSDVKEKVMQIIDFNKGKKR